ncbi:MAG: magnesium transporter [Candidatus Faecivicinus sp.]|nr:magnesium transporter [Candidatus Faecivicinus sp.]
MDFERICVKLNALLDAGKKAELRGALNMLNEVDIAEYLQTLDNDKMLLVFRLLPKDISAEIFSYMDSDQQTRIIDALGDEEAVRILDDMFIDDAVDFLEELPAGVVKRILKNCDENKRALINQFLRYPENSAGSIMTIEYMDFHVGTTVGQAMESIRQNAPDKETINTLYILDDRRVLLGTVALRKLLLSRDDCKVEQLMNTQVISVRTTDDQELVADTVRKYDLLSIPVVDHENRMVGIVTVDDIVDVIEEENTEDFEKMAAMLPSDDTYLKTSVLTLAKNRLPWLMILMISALFTGQIITHFESVLQNAASIGVALVASIPMLMDTGGNCGSQASTLAIRGLALGEIEPKNLWQVLWKELRVAMLLGVALASVNFLRIAFLTNYGTNVALIISLTMFCTIVIAKLIGGSLPLLAKAVHLDPALMASPLITTMVDAASLTILFTIATRIFHVGAA